MSIELHPQERGIRTGLCAPSPQRAGPLGPLEQACDESPSRDGRYIASAYGKAVNELHREHLRRVAADRAVTGALYVRAAGRGGE